MKSATVHIVHKSGFATLCGKTANRVRWVHREEADKSDCLKCRVYFAELPKKVSA